MVRYVRQNAPESEQGIPQTTPDRTPLRSLSHNDGAYVVWNDLPHNRLLMKIVSHSV